jgi:sarcosine oxidase subunit beta
MCGQGYMLGPGVGALLARMAAGALVVEDKETLEELSPYRALVGGERLG